MRIALCALGVALLAACNPNAETDNPVVATEEAVTERAADAPAAGANSFLEGQARDRIIAAGYTEPTGLVQTAEGMWMGQAMRDGQMVQVTVDYQGNVTPASGATPAPATGATPTTPTTNPR